MKATVLLPTSRGRGGLIRYSAGSVLRQTVRDFELFIIGDGVDDDTRWTARELAEQDPRVRFFDFPKHERRGEPYRHDLLMNEASGENVLYLCDRDLMLSDHLEVSCRNLERYEFSSTVIYMIQPDGSIRNQTINFLGEVTGRNRRRVGQLSRNAHTMRAYKALAHGWRTTPPDRGTDCYMWDQFLKSGKNRANVIAFPTILYFKQTLRRHWPVEQRRKELELWYTRLMSKDGELSIHRAAARQLYTDHHRLTEQIKALKKQLAHPLVIKGRTPGQAARRLTAKLFTGRPTGES